MWLSEHERHWSRATSHEHLWLEVCWNTWREDWNSGEAEVGVLSMGGRGSVCLSSEDLSCHSSLRERNLGEEGLGQDATEGF